MHKLNQHFLFFIRKIRTAKSNSNFTTTKYFHSSFLNASGRVTPNIRVNANLENKFKLFFNSYKILSQNLKDEFYSLVLMSRDFHLYFEDDNFDVRPLQRDNIRRIVGNDTFDGLMSALWDCLKTNSWEIDKHYEDVFNNMPESKTCPFCGINQMSNPQSYRADYDHLGLKGKYPLSCINLKNIAPSCSECNQKYKHDKDVFYADTPPIIRRPYNYIFSSFIDVQVTFTGTILPYTNPLNEAGQWVVNFFPDNNITTTWDAVYEIRQRYILDVLVIDYNTWIGEFIDEVKGHGINTVQELKRCFIMHFKRYGKRKLQKRYIVKSSLFKHFYKCNDNVFYNQLISQIN
jgi:hypothetical protein